MEQIEQTDVKVLQLESKLTVDSHGHVGVYLYVNYINLSTGPDLENPSNIKLSFRICSLTPTPMNSA